jgi:hypothetical protein
MALFWVPVITSKPEIGNYPKMASRLPTNTYGFAKLLGSMTIDENSNVIENHMSIQRHEMINGFCYRMGRRPDLRIKTPSQVREFANMHREKGNND